MLGQASVVAGLVNAASTEPSFLDSNTHFEGAVLEGLPKDQWKADVVRLEGYTRAYLQNAVLMRTTGYNVEADGLRAPQTDGERELCKGQKVVKPAGFVNIGVIPVILILSFAGLLAVLDFVILRFLIYHDKLKQPFRPALQDWIDDGIYHLQRVAYEASRTGGSWINKHKEIPVTPPGEKLRHSSSATLGLEKFVLGATTTTGHRPSSVDDQSMAPSTRDLSPTASRRRPSSESLPVPFDQASSLLLPKETLRSSH